METLYVRTDPLIFSPALEPHDFPVNFFLREQFPFSKSLPPEADLFSVSCAGMAAKIFVHWSFFLPPKDRGPLCCPIPFSPSGKDAAPFSPFLGEKFPTAIFFPVKMAFPFFLKLGCSPLDVSFFVTGLSAIPKQGLFPPLSSPPPHVPKGHSCFLKVPLSFSKLFASPSPQGLLAAFLFHAASVFFNETFRRPPRRTR